jgi:hypothetical protein
MAPAPILPRHRQAYAQELATGRVKRFPNAYERDEFCFDSPGWAKASGQCAGAQRIRLYQHRQTTRTPAPDAS